MNSFHPVSSVTPPVLYGDDRDAAIQHKMVTLACSVLALAAIAVTAKCFLIFFGRTPISELRGECFFVVCKTKKEALDRYIKTGGCGCSNAEQLFGPKPPDSVLLCGGLEEGYKRFLKTGSFDCPKTEAVKI